MVFYVYRHAGTVQDEQYMSEDSESTQSSDLDYILNIDVCLPDKSLQRTSILAR